MKTSECLPQSDLLPMELPLTQSAGASRARTSALQAGVAASQTEPEADYGQSSPVLLAKYDRNSFSWRTSQTCLVGLAKNEAGGLAEFSETWPNAGMMRSGIAFQLASLVPGPNGREFGFLPTPLKNSGNGAPRNRFFGSPHYRGNYGEGLRSGPGDPLYPQPDFAERVMGFPTGWTELGPAETP